MPNCNHRVADQYDFQINPGLGPDVRPLHGRFYLSPQKLRSACELSKVSDSSNAAFEHLKNLLIARLKLKYIINVSSKLCLLVGEF